MATSLESMTEQELREAPVPWLHTEAELTAYITSLVERQHDYGTCVYAMSMSALAAFNYVAHKLGCTAFQASCADMDFLARSRMMKMGFQILNYENLMFPQYLNEEKFPSLATLLDKNAKALADKARENLAKKGEMVHPDVVAHWEHLSQVQS